ncbi:MAG: TIGR04149 family rSAM-modified RiPP [Tannerellaceae bacterium]|nr:TIGR04149 family rSAM-modified RiPP [Tannerellaceae bacterium]
MGKKTLGKIKLNEFSKDAFELRKREMKNLVGGSGACTCVCWGSSYPTADYSISGHSNSAT